MAEDLLKEARARFEGAKEHADAFSTPGAVRSMVACLSYLLKWAEEHDAPLRPCPRCGLAPGPDEVDDLFGFRRMTPDGPIKRQSYCRRCRDEHKQERTT